MGDEFGGSDVVILHVSEVFGPTFQGEGPYAGRVAMFVRLGGCNLSCSWCDTPYTWDGVRFSLRHEIAPRLVSDIIDQLDASPGIVVITGGEPLLQARSEGFAHLLVELRRRGRYVHIESNGTLLPDGEILDGFDVIVLSPKLKNAGVHRGNQDPVLHAGWADVAQHREVHLKFVCESADDVATAAEMASALSWPRDRVWVMPEGTTAQVVGDRLPVIADAAIAAGINVTSRLHVAAWGDERGR